ncbi:zinc dependent phospholipase C family protein [Pseudodesulfovibrio sediminis]|uniref:Phospholipase C/D domain-containing protein n=1 Tax=Pseudodesulfovibrio sediminis TaxID=2810563 RepID=A0ABN6EVP0_9BACT|nr:zinc dependent phospholipase C family protein [Pseudodesulfovibrio sediminis]BCS89632.1 hypothetical protein PSDVSF_28740 [Pseudodesulfovibrio sediminis]
MPGAYAHLTMVNRFKTPQALDGIPGFTGEMAFPVTQWLKFLELGAVSPDYPYLKLLNDEAEHWANAMHHHKVGDRLKAGIRYVRDLDGVAKSKCFVWLLGFASHIAMDVTIHPVVNLKVGKYEDNKTDHRICEMNQDVHIFRELNLGAMAEAEIIRARIANCGAQDDTNNLDPDVKEAWTHMIVETSDAQERKKYPLNVGGWHGNFVSMLDNVEDTSRLPAFARHVLSGLGVGYPREDELQETFLLNLKVPGNRRMAYDDIFDKAQGNVAMLWSLIGRGCYGVDDDFESKIHNWDLDSGKVQEDESCVFWRD